MGAAEVFNLWLFFRIMPAYRNVARRRAGANHLTRITELKGGMIMPYGMGPAGWENRPYGYGRGWCWHPGWYGAPFPRWRPPTREDEIRFLEEEANFLREELGQIEKRLEELKK